MKLDRRPTFALLSTGFALAAIACGSVVSPAAPRLNVEDGPPDAGASDAADAGTNGFDADGNVGSCRATLPSVSGTSPTFGTPSMIQAHILNPPSKFVSDGTSLYWLDRWGYVWSVPIAGGTPEQIAQFSDYLSNQFLYVDASYVYGVSGDGVGAAPKSGGATIKILSQVNPGIVINGTYYYLDGLDQLQSAPLIVDGVTSTRGVSSSGGMGVVGSTVFWGSGVGTSEQPLGGSRSTVAGAQCQSIVSAPTGVYCAGGDAVAWLTLDGCLAPIGGEMGGATSVVTDATNLYWVNAVQSGNIMTASKGGGPTTVIAYDESPVAVTVDDAAVYWADALGQIYRAPKL